MKTIAAAVLAAQKTGAGRPIARAALADNGRLHPAALFTHSYSGAGVHSATAARSSCAPARPAARTRSTRR
jgi:hypothetical protein